MANGHLISDEEFELLELAKKLTGKFGYIDDQIVTYKGGEKTGMSLLLALIQKSWAVKNAQK